MKRILPLLIVLLFLAGTATATTFDLSGMSYEELVALKDQINLAMWNSQEWQEVTVPQGVWLVGSDIPAGHWTITTKAKWSYIQIGTALDATKKDIDIWKSDWFYSESVYNPNYRLYEAGSDKTEIDLELKNGTYVVIEDGDAVFTPYTGKPGLGFK